VRRKNVPLPHAPQSQAKIDILVDRGEIGIEASHLHEYPDAPVSPAPAAAGRARRLRASLLDCRHVFLLCA